MCSTDGARGGKMSRVESALWSALVGMLDLVCREGGWRGSLNKVAVDPTGAPIAPAVTAVNRHRI